MVRIRRECGEGNYKNAMENNFNLNIVEMLNTLILAITAIIVFWYTRATERSNEIQERPILNLYIRESGAGAGKILKLRNVGKGPAYNIQFFGIKASGYTYFPYFEEPNPILGSNGDEKEIELWVTTPNNGVEVYHNGFDLFYSRLFGESIINKNYDAVARSAGTFFIAYEGVNGKRYNSIFRIYSKIKPLIGMPSMNSLAVEFIVNKQGMCSLEKAKELCDQRPIIMKNEK